MPIIAAIILFIVFMFISWKATLIISGIILIVAYLAAKKAPTFDDPEMKM